MLARVRALWPNVSQSLAFIPAAIVVVFAATGIALVEVDTRVDLRGVDLVFRGDASAARTVLSVIAGSLITVAGLTFSTTMVVLQLASTQFSPRVLRTFLGDRLIQVTIGTYVGTFVYAILVLRAVGAFGEQGFVPRLSVTLASVMGIVVVILLIVFLNHVSQMVQVSHVTAGVAAGTLELVDELYPDRYGDVADVDDGAAVRHRREEPAGTIHAERPGYVQRVAIDELAAGLRGQASRAVVKVCPGDFVGAETVVAEVWPPEAARGCAAAVRDALTVERERDLGQDVDFGLRQLTDIALRALSPGVNDPMTAVTCIGYLRSVLVRLTERDEPATVLRFGHGDDDRLEVVARHRRYDELLEVIAQVGRSANGDAWVVGDLLGTLRACAEVARDAGAEGRLRTIAALAAAVAEQGAREAATARDRATIETAAASVDEISRPRPLPR
jgi:uncharacterized membrane protein